MTEPRSASTPRPPGKPQPRDGHGGQGKLHRILPETQARTGAQRSRTMRDRCPQPPRVSTRAVKSTEWREVAL